MLFFKNFIQFLIVGVQKELPLYLTGPLESKVA